MKYFVEKNIQETIKVLTKICQNNTRTFFEKSYLIFLFNNRYNSNTKQFRKIAKLVWNTLWKILFNKL